MSSPGEGRLRFASGPRKGEDFRLEGREVLIGRQEGDLILHDEEASRRHARIIPDGAGYAIEDLGSRNGTTVNGQPVTRARLTDSDEIEIGSTILRFCQAQDILLDEAGPAGPLGPDTFTLEAREGELSTRAVDESDPAAVQRARSDLAALYRFGQVISSILDTEELYRRVPAMVVQEMPNVDSCSIHVLDEATSRLQCVGYWNREGAGSQGAPAFSRSILQAVVREGRGVLTTDAGADQRFRDQASIVIQRIRSALCAPLKSRDRLLGVLQAHSTRPAHRLTPDDLRLLMAIGMQAGAALENAELYGKLAAEKAALDKANQELKAAQESLIQSEKLAAMGRMTAGIVHDVKNPMSVIMSFADLLDHLLQQPAGATAGGINVAGCINGIRQGVDHCTDVINKLLKFARQSKPDKVRLQVNAVLEDTLAFALHELRSAGGRVEKQLAPALPDVLADPSELKQVFLNILLNDIEAFRKEETGLIRISTGLEKQGDRDYVAVTIRDNGIGMTEEIRRRLFEPFFTTKKEGGQRGGTGLGLAMSYGIVQNHGGSVRVESEPGKGTTFVITLPVPTPPPDTVGPRQAGS